MFNSSEQSMLRARAISGDSAELIQVDSEIDESIEASSLTRYLQDAFRKAGYDDLYIHSFYKRVFFYAVFVSALALIVGHPVKYFLMLIVPLVYFARYKGKIAARVQNFEKDYTALLVSLASAIRSGIDPMAALMKSDVLFQPKAEVTKAIRKFRIQLEKGMSEEDAIQDFASDINHPDIDLFRSSFILARKEGSSIGECLHRLAKVTRQRQSFRRKVKAAVAMQKLSAFGISGCAVILTLMQYTANPKAMQMAMDHPVGSKIIITGIGLIFLGMIWMLNMTKNKL